MRKLTDEEVFWLALLVMILTFDAIFLFSPTAKLENESSRFAWMLA